MTENRATKENQDPQDPMENRVFVAFWAQEVVLVPLAHREYQVLKVPQDLRAIREE